MENMTYETTGFYTEVNQLIQKGMSAEDVGKAGKPVAKMLLHLLAESCIKCVGSSTQATKPRGRPMTDTNSSEESLHKSITNAFTISSEHISIESNLCSETQMEDDLIDSPTDEYPIDPLPLASSLVEDMETGSRLKDDSKSNVRAVRRRSPYRDVYEAARVKYADREDWSLGRQHNASLRIVKKTILKDLWLLYAAE